MATKVNLNADIAEGWGAYDIGNDAELMKIIKSASVACGFHAGDANTMHGCACWPREGVSVGAHPGFNDLWGFGRRRIQMKPTDLEYMVAYQIGALQAMAAYAGLKVTHLKAHGALNNMAAEDEGYALAIGRAIKAVDRDIIYVALSGSQMEKAARKLELRLAREGFPDRQYDDDGNLASRTIPGAVIKDPKVAASSARAHGTRRRGRVRQWQARQGAGGYAVRAWRRADRRPGRQRHPSALECRDCRRAADRDDAVAVCGHRDYSQPSRITP